MDNLSFLKKVLMSDYGHDYWLVAKRNEYGSKRDKDSIILTVIPYEIPRELKEKEILLSQLEALRNADMLTIHINDGYAPFQNGMNFYSVYDGFPINTNVKEFMLKAIELGSDKLYEYEQLANPKIELLKTAV